METRRGRACGEAPLPGDRYCFVGLISKKNKGAKPRQWSATQPLQFLLCATRCSVRTDRVYSKVEPRPVREALSDQKLSVVTVPWRPPLQGRGGGGEAPVSGGAAGVQQIHKHLRPHGVLGETRPAQLPTDRRPHPLGSASPSPPTPQQERLCPASV